MPGRASTAARRAENLDHVIPKSPRRPPHLGERRRGLPPVQRQEGRSHAERGRLPPGAPTLRSARRIPPHARTARAGVGRLPDLDTRRAARLPRRLTLIGGGVLAWRVNPLVWRPSPRPLLAATARMVAPARVDSEVPELRSGTATGGPVRTARRAAFGLARCGPAPRSTFSTEEAWRPFDVCPKAYRTAVRAVSMLTRWSASGINVGRSGGKGRRRDRSARHA